MADFKLTATTDPKTVMFEGHPDVTIARIEPTPSHEVGFYVIIGTRPSGTRFGDRNIQPGYNHRHDETGVDVSGRPGNLWPRIVPRFVLTKDTDPATVMFERKPDIVIEGFRERPEVVCSRPGQLYVGFRTSDSVYEQSIAHNSDGTWASGGSNYGSVVPRPAPAPAFDPFKPFHAQVVNTPGLHYRYELDATITPADGSEPRYVVKRSAGQPNAGSTLEVYASTGRITSKQACAPGSALCFVNGPVIETHDAIVMASKYAVTVRLTATDGEITAVEWIK